MPLPVIAALLGPIIRSVTKRFLKDPIERENLERELSAAIGEQAHALNLGQLEINKVEAASKHLLVAGWRPYAGWGCVTALIWHVLMQPLILFFLAIFKVTIIVPTFDIQIIFTILGGLLGMGSLRTYEKFKGVSRET